jgi:hypothetical protein
MRIDIKSESELESERAQPSASGAALAELAGMTPEALTALRGGGLDSPGAIVDAGRERLGELLTSPEQADEVFAAARQWASSRPAATASPDGDAATAPSPETESA